MSTSKELAGVCLNVKATKLTHFTISVVQISAALAATF